MISLLPRRFAPLFGILLAAGCPSNNGSLLGDPIIGPGVDDDDKDLQIGSTHPVPITALVFPNATETHQAQIRTNCIIGACGLRKKNALMLHFLE